MNKGYLIVITSLTIFFAGCTGRTPIAATSAPAKDTARPKENCAKVMDSAEVAAHISHRIKVTGAVEHPLDLNIDSLRAMRVVTVDSYAVACQTGTRMSEQKVCRGVLLRDILDKAGIHQTGQKDRGFYITARATDNYLAVFSWSELYNNTTGDHTYVTFEENGKPIGDKGEFVLICTNDTKTGPRHVYWLNAIEVHHIDQ